MSKKWSVIFLFIGLVSCKTVTIHKHTQQRATTAVELLTIGVQDSNIQTTSFETAIIPQLNEKVRVRALMLPFNKSTNKAYLVAAASQGEKNIVNYIDSLPVKPNYLTLNVIDKVTFLNELNSDYNNAEVHYLKTMDNAKLVTTVSLVFDTQTMIEISKADEIYISNKKLKKYQLELYKNKQFLKEIELTTATVFAYKLSAFCWGKNSKNKTAILNIIDANSKCIKPTYSDFQKSKEKNIFKF